MNRDNLIHSVQERLKRLPEPYSAHYGVVPLPPPQDAIVLGRVLPRIEAAQIALGKIEAVSAELKDPYLISRILPRKEAVSSSAIEGTNSTLDELLSIEEGADDDRTTEAIQVRDYAQTLDTFIPRAVAEKNEIFTLNLIQDLHRAVVKGDKAYKDVPGEFREVVVWIGGGRIENSGYNPAPPSDVVSCLEESVEYMRCDGMQAMTQSLLVRMAVAHSHFEAVHPFRDGNGRVGRLLLPLMMAAEGKTPLYLSSYIEANKQAYADVLKAAQQRLDWPQIIGFIADAVSGTVDELLETRAALRTLGDVWLKRRSFRKGSGAIRALEVLPHYPVVTIGRLSKLLDITVPAATIAVEQLASVGILKERTGYARNRVFAAPEALAVINRGFGQPLELPQT